MNVSVSLISTFALAAIALAPSSALADGAERCARAWETYQAKDRALKECTAQYASNPAAAMVACMDQSRVRDASLDILKQYDCSFTDGSYRGRD
jgi:hypothetical protein